MYEFSCARCGERFEELVGPHVGKEADDVAKVGTLQLVVPDAEGRLDLTLRLVHPEADATNAYAAMISR